MASASNGRSEATKGKGKHVTTACLGCRRRKIKCDGVTPRCSNCILYGQECVVQHGADKRKIAPKERLQTLTAYCQQLESLLASHGIPLPAAPPLYVQEANQRRDSAARFPSGTAAQSENWPPDTQGPGWSPDWRDQATHDQNASPHLKHDPDDNYFYSESSPEQHTAEVQNSNAEPDQLVDQLSGRMGSLQIAEDGQLRFYGATSNLHILHNGPLSLSRSKFRSPSEDGAGLLRGAGVGHVVDEGLEDHLLKLYFCWEDPTIHVVEESIFWRERRKCRIEGQVSSLYSEVLTNAMCSVGATLTSRRCPDLPDPLPDFFATRAKLLLELEMDAPTISTVQALVVLSAIEAALTRDARGWLDSGMAVRLGVDLGLHLDPAPYVQAGIISVEEGMIRKVVWGGVFVHDRMWSIYVGRPVGLDDKHITVRFSSPEEVSPPVLKSWSPYIDDSEVMDSPTLVDAIGELSIWNIKLCSHMTAIREELYSDRVAESKDIRQMLEFASNMTQKLTNWHHDLPPSLVIDTFDTSTMYLPHVLQLHMQYLCVVIIVNRPFFASAKMLPGLTVTEIASRRNTCTEAANSLARVVHIYRRLYGLRRINIQAVHLIFTATLIHVFTACGALDQTRSDNAWKNLEICSQALSEMGLVFKNAARALEVVMGIKSDLLKRSRSNSKRQNPWNDGQESELAPVKRRRPTDVDDSNLPRPDHAPPNLEASTFDSTFSDPNQTFNFFDTDYDEFSLDSLFWAGFNTLELPHIPPQDP